MNELFQNILFDLCMVIILTVLIWFVKNYLKKLLTLAVNNLVQLAEEGIKGSGLGAAKKAWVIAQLETAGIKIDTAVSNLIDDLVSSMNAAKTSLTQAVTSEMTQTISAAVDAASTITSDNTTEA